MNKSFAILHTNVGLSTNMKIMVSDLSGLSLDSIKSTDELSQLKIKSFVKENFFDELFSYYFDGISKDVAFCISNQRDITTMTDDLQYQYDDIYQYGARNIINNKSYKEEYEYFAPLYIIQNKLPKYFFIFRIDGHGNTTLTKDNFKEEILDKLKLIKIFGLNEDTEIGYFMNNNFVNNKYFPLSPLDVYFNTTNFTKWNGIDYDNGGYISKSKFMGDYYDNEKEIFEFERYMFDGYKNNGVIFPNILNLSFLFDDDVNPYSINRYYGFYVDGINEEKSYNLYQNFLQFTKINNKDINITITNNIIETTDNVDIFTNYNENIDNYIEWKGRCYKVKKEVIYGDYVLKNVRTGNVVIQQKVREEKYQYRIYADVDIDIRNGNDINSNIITDITDNIIEFNSLSLSYDTSVLIISLMGQYYKITSYDNNGKYKILTDKNIYIKNKYLYIDDEVYSLEEYSDNLIINVCRLQFTDIKDFDTKIVNTDYSSFEYEISNDITNTNESKFYMNDYVSKVIPTPKQTFSFRENNKAYIPVASEYTTNYETFKIIDNNTLSEIWNINPVYCRWSYKNSLNNGDVPYMLNNSYLMEDFNRSTDISKTEVNELDRNLDYYYTCCQTFSGASSLHLKDDFNLNTYVATGSSIDEFTDILTLDGHIKKYSYINPSDGYIENNTVFRGIKFNFYGVPNGLKKNANGYIDNYNVINSNEFDGYKFSMIMKSTNSNFVPIYQLDEDKLKNNEYPENTLVIDEDIIGAIYITSSNGLTVSSPTVTINEFWNDKRNYTSSLGYVSDVISKITKIKDSNGSDTYTIIPINSLNNLNLYDDLITYHDGEWWYCATTSTDTSVVSDFYSKNITYKTDNPKKVIFKESVFELNVNKITASTLKDVSAIKGFNPSKSIPILNSEKLVDLKTTSLANKFTLTKSLKLNPNDYDYDLMWNKLDNVSVVNKSGDTTTEVKWKRLSKTPTGNDGKFTPYIDGDDIMVYYYDGITQKHIAVPYNKAYFDAEPNYTYSVNDIIKYSDNYYYCETSSTLDNGIDIYINKIYKNVLIVINYNDGLLESDVQRTECYNSRYNVLSAQNIISAINDITNKYGFINYLKYHIIDKEGEKIYDFDNIDGLPYIITCDELPTEINMNLDSLKYEFVETPSELKINKKLGKQIYSNLSNINDYAGNPVAAKISDVEDETLVKNSVYRYDGGYCPLFNDLNIFDIDNLYFDVSYKNFGILKERKIKKYNKDGNILKLSKSDKYSSIYPMLDEFGCGVVNDFIFKSNWDNEFYTEVNKNDDDLSLKENISSAQPKLEKSKANAEDTVYHQEGY